MSRRVLYVIAPVGFRDEEYDIPKRILEKNGYEVVTASKGVSVANGSMGMSVQVDEDIADVDIDLYDAIVLAGGPGAPNYVGDQRIFELLDAADDDNILIAAICIAPLILAEIGLLKDKDFTVWDGGERKQISRIEAKGGNFVDKDVVVDGRIITGNGPDAAEKFGEALVEYLNEN